MLNSFKECLLDIVYPKTCAVCKKKLKGIPSIDETVCAECWAKIKKNLPPFCHRCGRHLESAGFTKNICPDCLRKNLCFDRAFSPCKYDGVLKELIHEFKYKNKEHFGSTLSRLMIEFIKEYGLPMDFMDAIIPIPLHKVKLREREFNQAQILSDYIAREFNKEVLTGVLMRHRNTKTQTGLLPDERFSNIKGSFSVTIDIPIKGKNILLVDDVLTTAATSSEAACVLKNAGANVVFVLALAN